MAHRSERDSAVSIISKLTLSNCYDIITQHCSTEEVSSCYCLIIGELAITENDYALWLKIIITAITQIIKYFYSNIRDHYDNQGGHGSTSAF